MRPGTYSQFTITRGIQILGEPGVRVAGFHAPSIAILGVPSGERVVLSGLNVTNLNTYSIWVTGCRGLVHLEGSLIEGLIGTYDSTLSLTDNRIAVDMAIAPGSALDVVGGEAIATRCTFIPLGFSGLEVPGIRIRSNGGVVLGECTVHGAPAPIVPGPTASAAIVVDWGRLTLAGTTASTVAAGPLTVTGSIGAPAIRVSGIASNLVIVAPSANLVPSGGMPAVLGAWRSIPLASLGASFTGRVLTATVQAPHASYAMIVAGPYDRPAPWLLPIDLWVGVQNIALGAGPIDPSGAYSVSHPIPALPLGTLAALQAFILDPTGVTLSTPMLLRVD
ncbi:MAG: hypothetical protein HZB39_04540 [Planctomycetes bacterium]|nr:hypothetical protein [Planctomycetota bacterium]